MKKVVFDHKQTNIAKGVALLMLLWHHLFYNNPETFNRFTSIYKLEGVLYDRPIECYFAVFCKVCVAIFLLLSGYGLFKSYSSWQNKANNKMTYKDDAKFVRYHISKLLLDYWYIYIIFVPLGLIFGRSFFQIYEGNIVYAIIDFFGLAHIFSTPTMNATWWFMGIIIIYYLLFPFFVRIIDYSPEISICIFLGFAFSTLELEQLRLYVLPFATGIYIAKYDLFERIEKNQSSTVNKVILSGALVVGSASIRYFSDHAITFDSFFAFSIVLTSYLLISNIPLLNKVLQELGKYSGSIFMFHTFIYSYYFQKYIFSVKYSILVFLLLTISCYVIARFLEWAKVITRYKKLYGVLAGK